MFFPNFDRLTKPDYHRTYKILFNKHLNLKLIFYCSYNLYFYKVLFKISLIILILKRY